MACAANTVGETTNDTALLALTEIVVRVKQVFVHEG